MTIRHNYFIGRRHTRTHLTTIDVGGCEREGCERENRLLGRDEKKKFKSPRACLVHRAIRATRSKGAEIVRRHRVESYNVSRSWQMAGPEVSGSSDPRGRSVGPPFGLQTHCTSKDDEKTLIKPSDALDMRAEPGLLSRGKSLRKTYGVERNEEKTYRPMAVFGYLNRTVESRPLKSSGHVWKSSTDAREIIL